MGDSNLERRPPGPASTVSGGPARGLTGEAKYKPHKVPCSARGACSQSRIGLGRFRGSSGPPRGDEGRGELRNCSFLQRQCPSRGGGAPHSIPLSKRGPRVQKGTGLVAQHPLYRRNSPQPRPKQTLPKARRAKRPNVQEPGGGAVPVLPRPTRREFEFPGIKVAARPAAGCKRGA